MYFDIKSWLDIVMSRLIVGCELVCDRVEFCDLKLKYVWMLVGDIRTLFQSPVIGMVVCVLLELECTGMEMILLVSCSKEQMLGYWLLEIVHPLQASSGELLKIRL